MMMIMMIMMIMMMVMVMIPMAKMRMGFSPAMPYSRTPSDQESKGVFLLGHPSFRQTTAGNMTARAEQFPKQKKIYIYIYNVFPVNSDFFSFHFQSISLNFILRHKHARFNSPSSAFREVCKPCAAWKPPNTPRKPKLRNLKHKLHKFTARIGIGVEHGSEVVQMQTCCQGTEPLSISRFICRQHRQQQNTQQNDWTEKLTTSATLSKSSAKCNHHISKFVAETPCPPPSIQYCFLAMHCFFSQHSYKN